jgi:hypothetical protein
LFEHLDAARVGFSLAHPPVNDQHLGHLVADPHRRVERLHRVLVNHRNPVTAQPAQFFL